MIQACEEKVKLARAAAAALASAGEAEPADNEPGDGSAQAENELQAWTTYIEKITTTLAALESKETKVEFHDESGASLQLQNAPKQKAADTLTMRASYTLMCYEEGKEPSAVFDMCDVESPLERQKKEDDAAEAEAAQQ